MSAETFQIISLVGFLLAIGFAVVAVILFFKLDVRRLYGILTGRAERVGIEKIKTENKELAKTQPDKTATLQLDAAKASKQTALNGTLSYGLGLQDGTVLLQNQGDGTTLLQNNEVGTTLLQNTDEGTTLLQDAGGTTLLQNADDGTTLLQNENDGTTLLNMDSDGTMLLGASSDINSDFIITKDEIFASSQTVLEI